MELIRTWGQVERPWGFEVRLDFEDNKRIFNEVYTSKEKPDQKVLDAYVAETIKRLEAQVAAEALAPKEPDKPSAPELKDIYTRLVTVQKSTTDTAAKSSLTAVIDIAYNAMSAADKASVAPKEGVK